MKNKLLLCLGLLFGLQTAFAQILQEDEPQRGCVTQQNHLENLEKDPKYAERLAQVEEFTRQFVENYDLTAQNAFVQIPVVFHIVHNGDAVGSGENISDALVLAQLQQLNDDFNALNSDFGNVPSEFQSVAADMEIEFCLASVDPNGNATSGINRINGGRTSWTRTQIESSLKPSTIWDSGSYLNFWSVVFGGSDSGLLGYAQFPGGASNTDGVVCLYSTLGSVASPNPAGGSFARGRTGTHEVGHWINLRHIWGDDGTSCTGSDLVNDTPNQAGPNYGTPSYPSSTCGSSDMFMNYMDYVNDTAMFMFSNGQKARAQAAIQSFRSSLLNSNGCGQGTAPTCSDGVQNGNETGVDCGGPDCAPCSTGCNDNDVTLTITLDNYPEETTWSIVNDAGSTVASGGPYGSFPDGTTITEDLCLVDDCYTFTIFDAYGDGICCSYGIGSYTLTGPSGTLASGGAFASSESTSFCLNSAPAPTCTDGIQNGNETGVDCGGPDCDPCVVPPTCDDGIQNGDEEGVDCGGSSCAPCVTPPTCDDGIQNGDEEGVDCGGSSCAPCSTGGSTVLHEGFFESGWDGWVDGGSDAWRNTNSTYAWEGSGSIRIRDNSGTASSMTLNNLNTSGFDAVEVEFYFYPRGMETGEDFWLRFNNGSSWTTVATWARGTDFENNGFYVATVVLDASQYSFGPNTDFRFQCDASVNNDRIYIDAVTITGVNGSGNRTNSVTPLSTAIAQRDVLIEQDDKEAMVYPNPAYDIINIESSLDIDEKDASFQVISYAGKVVQAGELNNQQIDVSDLPSGFYVVVITTEDDRETLKFIKR